MAKGDVLGRMDCVCCGGKGTVRVSQDKNGDPFGFCERGGCCMQYRFGGKESRVEMFNEYHQQKPASGQGQPPAPGPGFDPKTDDPRKTALAKPPAAAPAPEKPKRSGAGVFDALLRATA